MLTGKDWPKTAEALTFVEAVLTDGTLREQLVARGRARATHFEWTAVARQTLAVYDAVYRGARSA